MGAKRVTANQIEEVLLIQRTKYRDKFYETPLVNSKPLCFEIDNGVTVTIIISRIHLREHCRNRCLLQCHYNKLLFVKRLFKSLGLYQLHSHYVE